MTDPQPSHPSHQIAADAAKQIIQRGTDAGLSWSEIAVSLETTITIVACACAAMSKTPRPAAFIQEVIDAATERAHVRATEYIRSVRNA